MELHDIKKLTAASILFMGLMSVSVRPVAAQGQAGMQDKQATMHAAHSMNGTAAIDNQFINKASEANLAEIQLAKMALEKSTTEEITDFAEIMLEQHTAAQTELYSIISKSPAKYPGITMTNPGNNETTADETNIDSPDNDADKTATMGGTGGTTGNSMASGKTNGRYNSNLGGNNDQNTNSTPATSTGSTTRESNTAGTITPNGSGDDASNTTAKGATATAGSTAYLSNELSPEHKELMRKLATLSGAAFDRAYAQAMIKEHEKAVELFEKETLQSKDEDLQAFASRMVTVLREHYMLSKKLTNQR